MEGSGDNKSRAFQQTSPFEGKRTTDILGGKSRKIYVPTPDDIAQAKDLFGRKMQDDVYLNTIDISEGNFGADNFWYEFVRKQNKLLDRFGRHYPTRETALDDIFPQALEDTTEILALRNRERELLDAAFVDGLTGAYNKAYYDKIVGDRVRQYTQHGRQITVARVDLDSFKKYNDEHPDKHKHGDMALQTISGIMRNLTRAEDDVCRIGGDEFAVVFYDANPDDVEIALARIQDAVKSRAELNIPENGVITNNPGTLSIGIVGNAGKEVALEELDKNADTAAYISKETGKDRITQYKEGMVKPEAQVPAEPEYQI